MRPTRLLPIAVLLALLAPAAASAKVRNVPDVLGSKLGKLTAATPLAVLLPETLPFDYGGKLYGAVSGGKRRWSVTIAGDPACGGANACTLAWLDAQKGGKPHNTREVPLANGITGYFAPLSCGGSCSPPSIEFSTGGVLYEIAARVAAKGRTDRGILKAAANSAIRHGPR